MNLMTENEVVLPEITIKAFILGIILAIVLAASNAYLGLKAGTTVSASIPAAIISMGVLRLFRKSNIFENNIVQTAASAGEALVAGMIFVFPALLVLGYWHNFHYWECVLLAISGSGLGVVFSVPIRRVMLNNPLLPFPEGVAIGNVLKATNAEGTNIRYLLSGGGVGAVIGLAQDGLQVLSNSIMKFVQIGNTIFGYGLGFSPALLAAGYIVGARVGVSVLIGIILGWLVALPIDSHLTNIHHLASMDFYNQVGRNDIRFIGLGVMLVGGFATILTLLKPLAGGLQAVLKQRKAVRVGHRVVSRNDRDIPFSYTLWIFIACVLINIFVLRYEVVHSMNLSPERVAVLVVSLAAFIVIATFAFSALCAYFSGLVGATNNPCSAMALATVILCSFVVITTLGAHLNMVHLAPAVFVIFACSVVTISAVICAENIQDLKAGQMIDATPWKQQLMMMFGAVAAAFVVPFILQLLFNAYGMAGIYPHPGMNPAESLSAPQGMMIAIVVKAVFAHNLPWTVLSGGFAIAIVCMLANIFLKRFNLVVLVMAVGLGIYLPFDATAPLVLGALAAFIVECKEKKRSQKTTEVVENQQNALMLACGMVAGSALMGVILAIPFAISKSTSVLAIAPKNFETISVLFSVIVTFGLLRWFYKVGTLVREPLKG